MKSNEKKILRTVLPFNVPTCDIQKRMDYHKWLAGLSIFEITASVAAYRYFEPTNGFHMFGFIFGWVLLIFTLWVSFQYLFLLTTSFYKIKTKHAKKLYKAFDEIKNIMPLRKILPYFIAVQNLPDFISYFFMIGSLSLIVAIIVSLAGVYLIPTLAALLCTTVLLIFLSGYYANNSKEIREYVLSIEKSKGVKS